jgi:hypothetical protein
VMYANHALEAYRQFARLATFRRKIDVFGSTVNGFGRAKTAGLPAVFFEGFGSERATCVTAFPWRGQY